MKSPHFCWLSCFLCHTVHHLILYLAFFATPAATAFPVIPWTSSYQLATLSYFLTITFAGFWKKLYFLLVPFLLLMRCLQSSSLSITTQLPAWPPQVHLTSLCCLTAFSHGLEVHLYLVVFLLALVRLHHCLQPGALVHR